MTHRPRERRLTSAIDDILESYREHGNINHLDGANLPSRSEVSRLLSDLLSIVFPGYFVQEQVDSLNCRWFVGERCARVLRDLELAASRAIAAQGLPRPSETGHEAAMALLQAIPRIREILDTDVRAAVMGDPAAISAAEVIMSYPGVEAIAVHRLAHALHRMEIPLLPRMMSELIHHRTGIDIHPGATIGPSFFIDHGTGLVIGETTLIGAHVKLYQGVTLGALSVSKEQCCDRKRHPTLEDDVTIYAGATILGGDTTIGRGSTIGGNVWLTHSVPANTTVVLDQPSLRFFSNDGRTGVDGE